MARRTVTVTISTKGRDAGKVFVLTEKPARESEDWAARAMFAMMNSGMEIPDDIVEQGLAGVAAIGLKALSNLPYDLAKPLLDSMMTCVQVQPSPNVTRPLIEDDIEEVSTLIQLRKEVLALHVDFSIAASLSTSASAAQETTA